MVNNSGWLLSFIEMEKTPDFWQSFERPVFALAPMEDVTETVFREVVGSVSSPKRLHVFFTEFMSVDGFLHEKGRARVAERLIVSVRERKMLQDKGYKLVAQIWGTDPDKFKRAAQVITEEYDFDGIDINMGCPIKKIVKNGGCSALIGTPDLAKEIILATMEGTLLPVSVKTRIGLKTPITQEWIGQLLETKPSAITLHGRTQKMMSEGEADWNEIARAVEVRNRHDSETLILGNGDVSSYEDGLERIAATGADGAMIGRGIFGNPALFSADPELTIERRFELLNLHLNRFEEQWGGIKNYAILKRFFKIYVNSFKDAGALRARLMETNSYDEGGSIITEFHKQMQLSDS